MTLDIVQETRRFENLSPKGEPRLGPRGLFKDASASGYYGY
jgi:aminopeptidase-like protein